MPEREAGLAAALRSVVRRRTRSVEVVAEVSFRLQPGEFVGFVDVNEQVFAGALDGERQRGV